MAVVASIFDGMQGASEVHTHNLIPSTGFRSQQAGNKNPMRLFEAPTAPDHFPASIDYSTRRGVLPCKGIIHHVLRRPALPSAGGMIPPSGVGRHQDKGLAYMEEKPTNLPLMPLAGFFDSATNNPLGQPE